MEPSLALVSRAMATILLVSCAGSAAAQLSLNQLTACEDLSGVAASVTAWRDDAPKACRSPDGPIERSIARRIDLKQENLCFLRASPAPSLSEYGCMVLRNTSSSQLICFRPASLSQVRSYKASFQGIDDARSVDYMRRASKCPTSLGHTEALNPITYPVPMMIVSRAEFGFIDKMNKEGSAYVIHAFGRVDPSLRASPDAVEVVSLVSGGILPEIAPSSVSRVGSWRIVTEQDSERARELNRIYRLQNAPIRVKMLNFDISRPSDFSGRDKSRIERLRSDLVRGLVEEGFEEVDLESLRLADGKSLPEVMQEMEAQVPYGMRKLYSLPERRGTISMLKSTRRLGCTVGENDVVLAFLITSKPDPDEASDYGSVSIMLGGIGRCSKFTDATGRYVRGLLSDTESRALAHFE